MPIYLQIVCDCFPTPSVQFSSVQSLSPVRLFVTPWTAALQASLSITNSQSLLKLMSITLVMPCNHLILSCPLLFLPSISPSIRVFTDGLLPSPFPASESVLCISGQNTGAGALSSILTKNLQSPLDSREIKPVSPEEINPEYSLERLMLVLKLQYFSHLMQRDNSLEKTLMLGKTEGRRRRE